jgi:organic hydroperoxide reductase OsmC/OhrA
VPLLRSVEENIGPKEAFVPAISSCHMLFVLPIAAEKVYQVEN